MFPLDRAAFRMTLRDRSPRAAALFLFLLTGVTACRRDVARLDEVQKMAYSVKPAVVRISAYATAEFHYSPETLAAVERALVEQGFDAAARNVPHDDGVVETGAGGSGSGFIIHPDGFIL